MGIAIRDAIRLAAINRARSEQIDARRGVLVARVDSERDLFARRCRDLRENALAPVLAAFAALRDGEVPVTPSPAVPSRPSAPTRPAAARQAPRPLPWRGRRTLREQRAIGFALSRTDAALGRVETRWVDGLAHSRQVREALGDLQTVIAGRAPAFAALVDGHPVATWTSDQHGECATLVDLVTAASTLSTTLPVDGTGAATPTSRTALADARTRLAELRDEPSHESAVA